MAARSSTVVDARYDRYIRACDGTKDLVSWKVHIITAHCATRQQTCGYLPTPSHMLQTNSAIITFLPSTRHSFSGFSKDFHEIGKRKLTEVKEIEQERGV